MEHAMSQCPFANLIDPDTYMNGMPYDELAKLRQEGPLLKMDDPLTGVPYWLPTGREEMDFISKNPKLFSSAVRGPFPNEFPQEQIEMVHNQYIIGMDPPQHLQFRRIMRAAFTPKAVASYEPRFRMHAKNIVDAVAGKGECEFIEEVAAELPLFAVLELMGVPTEDRKQFFDWTNTMIFADDPSMATSQEEGNQAAAEMLAYAMNMAAQHRKEPMTGTVTAALLDAEIDGQPITEEQFGWMFLLTMVGGNESTRTVTAHGMRLLMENPDQLQFLVENPQHIKAAVEEMLRYNTAFIAMRRNAVEDVELSGQTIKAGDKVLLHYHIVNQSEDVFGDDAMVFDIHRAINKDIANEHRSFGVGQHFCIGSHLARLELQVMMEEIIPRLRNPKFAADPKYVRSFFVNAISEMKITFDPETGS
jgi:cytochrome P450